jgi:hypothetical protein
MTSARSSSSLSRFGFTGGIRSRIGGRGVTRRSDDTAAGDVITLASVIPTGACSVSRRRRTRIAKKKRPAPVAEM